MQTELFTSLFPFTKLKTERKEVFCVGGHGLVNLEGAGTKCPCNQRLNVNEWWLTSRVSIQWIEILTQELNQRNYMCVAPVWCKNCSKILSSCRMAVVFVDAIL